MTSWSPACATRQRWSSLRQRGPSATCGTSQHGSSAQPSLCCSCSSAAASQCCALLQVWRCQHNSLAAQGLVPMYLLCLRLKAVAVLSKCTWRHSICSAWHTSVSGLNSVWLVRTYAQCLEAAADSRHIRNHAETMTGSSSKSNRRLLVHGPHQLPHSSLRSSAPRTWRLCFSNYALRA